MNDDQLKSENQPTISGRSVLASLAFSKPGFVIFLLFLLIFCSFVITHLWTTNQRLEEELDYGKRMSQEYASFAAGTTILKVKEDDHRRGSPQAKIVLFEYSDLECPFCKRFHATMQTILKEYEGKVAWVYRHLPLQIHPGAQMEAESAECVAELGGEEAFWKYIDTIFARTASAGASFTVDQLSQIAQEVGVGPASFQSCVESGKYRQLVLSQQQDAMELGIQGTPGSLIVGPPGTDPQLIRGALPYVELKKTLDMILE